MNDFERYASPVSGRYESVGLEASLIVTDQAAVPLKPVHDDDVVSVREMIVGRTLVIYVV
jgi:hypothetical protein